MRYAQICHCTNASYGTRMILAHFGWSMTTNLWSVGICRAADPANMNRQHRLTIKPHNRSYNNHRQINHIKRQPQLRNGYRPHSNTIRCKTGKIHRNQTNPNNILLDSSFGKQPNEKWCSTAKWSPESWIRTQNKNKTSKTFQFGDQRFEISHFIGHKYDENRIQMVILLHFHKTRTKYYVYCQCKNQNKKQIKTIGTKLSWPQRYLKVLPALSNAFREPNWLKKPLTIKQKSI